MKRQMWKKLEAWLLAVVMVVSVISGFGTTKTAKAATKMGVTYTVHVQTYGDRQGWVSNGASAGTSGQGKRLEEIRIKLTGNEYTGSIQYKTHIQSYGWQNWVADGTNSGSRGQAKRLEGIEIMLTGEVAKHYDVEYRVHCQTYGWMNWVRNGVMAGTSGQAKRLEAIQIRLVPKSQVTDMGVTYRTHCQSYGWLNWVADGASSGTTGQGKRLEAIEIQLTGNRYSGSVKYRTHVQSYGWEQNMVSNGALSGTSGQAKRLEAIEIALEGEIANYYDICYRVHAQSYGWLGWAINGERAGTSGMGKRLESIEIQLVPRGQGANLKSGNRAFIDGLTAASTPTPSAPAQGYTVTPANADIAAQQVLELVNKERNARGLKSLTLDPTLTKAANIRAKEIVTLFSHTRPNNTSCFTVLDEVGYSYMACGENIAAGAADSDFVMGMWMGSTGHRRNILSAGFSRLGVGYVYIPNSEYGYYWVQMFSD